jgi:hypothetical protein
MPHRAMAYGEVGKDEFLLFDGEGRENSLGFFHRPARVNRTIARFR